MDLEIILKNEVSQGEKYKYYMILFAVESKKNIKWTYFQTASQTLKTNLCVSKGKGGGDKLGDWD